MTLATIGPDGLLSLGPHRFRAALGKGGIRHDKREGDGATPVGTLKLRRVFFRADRLPRPSAAVSAILLAPDDGWCDDPASPQYNRLVRRPFAASHEALWREDEIYDVVGVLGWNDAPVLPGRGSAIFLHLARPDYAPTEGCIALSRPDLLLALHEGLSGITVAA